MLHTHRFGKRHFWAAGTFSPRTVDWMVFGVCLVLSATGALWMHVAGQESLWPTKPWPALAVVPFSTVPLLWRRSYPGAVLLVLAAAFAASFAVGAGVALAGLLAGAYAAALYGGSRTQLMTGMAAVVAVAGAFATLLIPDDMRLRFSAHVALFALFSYGVAWVAGDRTRTKRAYVAELEDRAARLEQERDEKARLAAELERSRIARELHDVVAHNVSVIAVQAGAARATARSPAARTSETLELIERTARGTLSELRALLGVLRRGEEAAPSRSPQPTLAQLEELVIEARKAGVRVETRVQGDQHPLPALVDLAAYRVVQEALTNVMKHAPGASVHVLVQYDERELQVAVVDDGPGVPAVDTDGHGLIGMRERVALVGGDLTVGPALGGGFRVAARLPLDVDGGRQLLTSADSMICGERTAP